jgi:DNA-binding NarL/FixJ family response regulator
MKTLFSIIESPSHPMLSPLYKELGFEEQRFTNMRKAISALKKTQPDFVVADFLYGYGNNYAGVNVSNLDVFLHSLQKYAPEAKVIVLVSKQEQQYIEKLANLFSLEAFFTYPVDQKAIGSVLS